MVLNSSMPELARTREKEDISLTTFVFLLTRTSNLGGNFILRAKGWGGEEDKFLGEGRGGGCGSKKVKNHCYISIFFFVL